MAGPYFVDDGGDGSTEDSWATADTSINALDAEYAFASGEIVYFGSDHVCQATNSANLTITGPTSGLPVLFISSTVGSGTTVSYAASTSNQIDTSEGAYSLTFDGSFALIGICCKCGDNITLGNDADETAVAVDCTFKPASNRSMLLSSSEGAATHIKNCTIDCIADTAGAKTAAIVANGSGARITGLTLANCGNRTGPIVGSCKCREISGCNFSAANNVAGAVLASWLSTTSIETAISNCLMASTWTPTSGTTGPGNSLMITNTGPADAPTYLYFAEYAGTVVSSASIYRTGGATIEGDATAWLITTNATCSEQLPFRTPWIYGTVASTGSKAFDLYITNDTADFTDAEVWLEVEYLSTADEPIWALATDQRATITATAAAQTDDTTSTWNGTGPSFTYKQKLSVTATVNETGQYRARVAVGVASIAGSRYFYCDPKIGIS